MIRSPAHRQHGGMDEGAPGLNLSLDITIHWLYNLTVLCLNVLICEMGTEISPTLQDCYRAALSDAVNGH